MGSEAHLAIQQGCCHRIVTGRAGQEIALQADPQSEALFKIHACHRLPRTMTDDVQTKCLHRRKRGIPAVLQF
jgi:hypothetical protein